MINKSKIAISRLFKMILSLFIVISFSLDTTIGSQKLLNKMRPNRTTAAKSNPTGEDLKNLFNEGNLIARAITVRNGKTNLLDFAEFYEETRVW